MGLVSRPLESTLARKWTRSLAYGQVVGFALYRDDEYAVVLVSDGIGMRQRI